MKPGAGQGVTVAGGPMPCTERYWSKLLHRLGQRSRTPRLPNHRLRLQDARAGQPHAETHAIPRGRAAAAGWRGSGTVAPPGRY